MFALVLLLGFSSENGFVQDLKVDQQEKKGGVIQSGSELGPPLILFSENRINRQMLAAEDSQLNGQQRNQIESIEKHLENIQKKRQHSYAATEATQNTALNRAQQKAKEIQNRLDSATTEIESITKAETKILSKLNETEQLLGRLRKEMATNRTALNKVATILKTHQTGLKQLEEKIIDQETYIAKRMVALYKLSWLGQLPILATANSGIDFFKRKASIEHILNHDQLEFDQLQQEKKTLKQMLAQLNAQQSEKKRIEAQLIEQKKALMTQLDKRTRFLTQIKNRKELQLAAINELEQAAQKLDQAISSLSEVSTKSGNTVPSSERDFSKFKGLLNLPVKGKIIYFYGPYKNQKFDVVNFRTGITIQADRGEPIRSVGSGVIIYADWFRGYGNMIIIDHGNRYYTVYAHLEEFFKSNGDRVEVDEVIATVGDTGSMGGAGLHFEVRHHGKPLDPMEWIRKG